MASVLGSDGEELPDDRDGPGRVEDRQPDDPTLLDRVVFWEIVAVEWADDRHTTRRGPALLRPPAVHLLQQIEAAGDVGLAEADA